MTTWISAERMFAPAARNPPPFAAAQRCQLPGTVEVMIDQEDELLDASDDWQRAKRTG